MIKPGGAGKNLEYFKNTKFPWLIKLIEFFKKDAFISPCSKWPCYYLKVAFFQIARLKTPELRRKNQKGRAMPVDDRPVGRKQWWLEKQQWNRAPVRSWMRGRNEQLLGWFNPFSRSFYVTELWGFHLLRSTINQFNSLFQRCYDMTLGQSSFLIWNVT